MVNLIVTIPGASASRIAITGHYDTKLFREFRFVGASDGGSSAAFLIELARVLKARKNALTMEIVFLDGEEAVIEWRGTDHTYGSRHYVEIAQRAKTLAGAEGDDPRGHDRGSRPRHPARFELHAVAHRHRVEHRRAPEARQRTSCRRRRRWKTTTSRSWRRAFRRWTSSTSTTPAWHTQQDTLDAVSARSLQVVGDVLLAALPQIEARLVRQNP